MALKSFATRFLAPQASPDVGILLLARGLRAFGDGLISLVLPIYLSLLGYSAGQIGLFAAVTLLGSSLLTIGVGFAARALSERPLLLCAAALMTLSGIAFVTVEEFGALMIVAFLGTLAPSAGEASVFLPLEQTLLSQSTPASRRTALFARYSLLGTLTGALGALAASLPDLVSRSAALDLLWTLRLCFILYAGIGLIIMFLYARLAYGGREQAFIRQGPLTSSRGVVFRLAALFSLDAFAGGFVIQSLLALWLFEHFDVALATAATLFFWMGLLTAFSFLAAPWLANRIGLINTMVFTQLPANICLVVIPFIPSLPVVIALLLARSLLQQMDVPTRNSYVMAVVYPEERAIAAGLTSVSRTLSSSMSPGLSGILLSLSSFGWPLLIGGALKIVYDLLLLRSFSDIRLSDEAPDHSRTASSRPSVSHALKKREGMTDERSSTP